jgi:hypothetical protein
VALQQTPGTSSCLQQHVHARQVIKDKAYSTKLAMAVAACMHAWTLCCAATDTPPPDNATPWLVDA